jgi:DNA excision repair protein ERCC-2
MCIHPEVNTAENRDKVDALCRNRTASFVRERRDAGNVQLCDFYEGFLRDGSDASISGIYSLEDMKELGRERQWCPYFLARRLINMVRCAPRCEYLEPACVGAVRSRETDSMRCAPAQASVVVYNYQYLLDPKISNMVSREIENESIVVFDEAHNIDNVCIEALSVVLDKQVVLASSRNVKTLERRVKVGCRRAESALLAAR